MEVTSRTPDDTFDLGRKLGEDLRAGDLVLLYGGLGAGKTLFTKGILDALGFDVDEVTSPSFSLVNLYKSSTFKVFHIDLWRIEGGDAASSVGLDEILDEPNTVTIVEWAERLNGTTFSNRTVTVKLAGDGDEPRVIVVSMPEDNVPKSTA